MTESQADREVGDEAAGLLLIGASVRAAAQSAIAAGWDVVAADLFADRDLRRIAPCLRVQRYPAEFAEVRASFPSRSVVYTGALENYPALLDQLASIGPLLGNGADAVREVRDPFRLGEALERHDIPWPEVRRRPPAAGEAGHWLLKPFHSAGGSRVRSWRPGLLASGADHGNYFLQRFVPGTTCSASFLATGHGCHLLGTTEMLVGRHWAGAAGFTYCGSILRRPASVEWRQWDRIGSAIAREFSLTGLFGVDGVAAGGQIWPIEVNPRYTASMELIERALGIPLVGAHADACRGRQLAAVPAPMTDGPVLGKSILYAPHDLQLNTRFRDPSSYSSSRNPRRVKLADLPDPGGIVRRGRPILTVVVTASNRDQVVKELRVWSVELMTQTTPLESAPDDSRANQGDEHEH